MRQANLIEVLRWTGIAVVFGAITVYGYENSRFRHDHAINSDGCLAFVTPPGVLAVVTDVTDPLAADQPRKWRATVSERVAAAPASTKLFFTTIGATEPVELPLFSGPCVPPLGNGPVLASVHRALNHALDVAEQRFDAATPTKGSAIRSTILAVASDPEFLVAQRRDILVLTDLLENDGAVSAYRAHDFSLPPALGKPLAGTTLHLTVLKNGRDERLQTQKLVRAWIEWATRAGAKVSVDAAWLGFPDLEPSPQELVRQ